jgi:hypothetical protein
MAGVAGSSAACSPGCSRSSVLGRLVSEYRPEVPIGLASKSPLGERGQRNATRVASPA